MPQIVLTENQALELSQAREKVLLCDPTGNVIGVIDPFDAMALANHRKRTGNSEGAGISAETADRELDLLQAEWDRTGGFDDEYMEAFLERVKQGNEQS